ncbi:FAD-dependent oxidoreductase [Nocardioides panacis]|uniref:FAD-dependent oxidoreductase n=1 Tax=Nocardioides panacis TaxID=2849501 RepID=A0A975T1I7_9ACTN|nr:FAD-dependent oxidoreductase [Nocardioides panacis]
MATWFDDGSPEIPGGVVGSVERVLVVGAGIAGLTVANALAHAAVDCVVLEARRRVGGRLHTADLAGSRVDLGGSWIHHPVGNPLRRFAESVGLGCRPADPLPSLSGFDCPTERRLSRAEVEAGMIAELDGFTEALDGLRARLGPAASAADGIEAYLAATGLTAEPLRRARQGLRASVEADAAGAAEHQSLEWLWTQEEYGGDYFGDVPEDGYGAVVDAMAAGLDVRHDWPVARVDLTEGGVAVTSESGTTEAGSHVVVTVPPGCAEERRAEVRATASARADRGRAPAGLRAVREGRARVRRGLLAPGRVVPPGAVPARGDRARCVGVRPRRVRCGAGAGVPHVPLRHRSPGRGPARRRGQPGDGHAVGGAGRTVPRAGRGRGDRLGGGPLHVRCLHPRAPRLLQRRPGPARDTRRGPPALRGRAHAERASRLCRRCHDERSPRGQAAAGHLDGGAGPAHRPRLSPAGPGLRAVRCARTSRRR